jgi:nitrite reductase/ring-hydroxylating ferredoxin subunit
MQEYFVARKDDLSEGDRRIVRAGQSEVGVFHHQGAYYAYANTCVHSGGPACEGIMIPKVLDVIGEDRSYQGQVFSDEMHFVCPWHGYEYDLKTGECAGDRRLKLKKYQVVDRDGAIYVIA